jgi:hypothetical protein
MPQSVLRPYKPKVQYSTKTSFRTVRASPVNRGRILANALKGIRMNQKRCLTLCAWLAAGSLCFGATVPAGTALMVRTNAAISTHATPGNHFTATLERNVDRIRAGAHCQGIIRTSRGSRSTTSTSPLTLVLTAISANGHTVKIKTDSVHPQGAHTTSTRRGSFSVGEDVFPAGTRLEFRLTQPLHF